MREYPSKSTIAAAFGSAAESYESAADLQLIVAARLAERIRALPLAPHPRILEIGCGTGLFTRALASALTADWTITDLSEVMLRRCRAAVPQLHDARFAVMDGERPCFTAGFDLVASSLAFQWLSDLPSAIGQCTALLRPGGYLTFATLGADTFQEWRHAFAEDGVALALRPYPTADALQALLGPGGSVSAETIERRYASGWDFLHRLRAIGAHKGAAGPALSPGALRRTLRRWERGITVRYHILYATLRVS